MRHQSTPFPFFSLWRFVMFTVSDDKDHHLARSLVAVGRLASSWPRWMRDSGALVTGDKGDVKSSVSEGL